MRKIIKFFCLPFSQEWLLVKTALLLSAIRIALWVFPYPSVRPLLERGSVRSNKLSKTSANAESIAWAVSQVGSVVPGGKHCLSQALALRVLLARRGIPVDVSFGVTRGADSIVMAHAWVEHNGKVLIGGSNLDRFIRLAGPEESRSDSSSTPNRLA